MAWWLGFALLLSPWLVMMLGQAWVQWGLACKAVHDDRSGLRSASDFPTRLGYVWDASTDQSAAWCACVETRPCNRASTGVVREAMEAKGVVCRRRSVSTRPCKGTECAHVSVDCMDSQ
jgi:hypothetical protein